MKGNLIMERNLQQKMKERVSNIDNRNRWTFWTETHGRDARGFCGREENAC